MGIVERVAGWLKSQGNREPRIITVFPKGTVVSYNGVPCELLCDTPYYSATYSSGTRTVTNVCCAENKPEDCRV